MFKKQIEYNDWATRRVLTALGAISTEIPEKILDLLGHVISAQSIWVSRISNQPSDVKVWQRYPLHDCAAAHEASMSVLRQYAANESLPDRKVSYVTTTGQHWETNLHDILIHLVNHGTYHRAQIATEMRRHGIEPVNTDYITFARQA